MGKEHEEAYGEGKQDAENNVPNESGQTGAETAALYATGIGAIFDGLLPGSSTVQQSYDAGHEDGEEEEED